MDSVRLTGVDSGKLLAVYLKDHLAGASASVELFKRASKAQQDASRRLSLSYLSAEVAGDRDALLNVMARLGIRVAALPAAAGWVAEKIGRLKLNGTVVRRSPLSDLMELEAMRLGIEGKACLWASLAVVAETDDRLQTTEFERLAQRAYSQISELESMRQSAAEALRP